MKRRERVRLYDEYAFSVRTERAQAIQDLQVALRDYNLKGSIGKVEAMGRIVYRLLDLELK